MSNHLEESKENAKTVLDKLKGTYYMNLSALKRRRGGEGVEESDKSIAIIINMLRGKIKEEGVMEE